MHATTCARSRLCCLQIQTTRFTGRLLAFSALILGFGLVSDAGAMSYDRQRDAFLDAVAIVETGGNARAVGSKGERGLYQFTRATWQQHTKHSHYEAHDPEFSRKIAQKHYDWLYSNLSRKGFPPSPYWLAVAWNSGLSRTTTGKPPSMSRRYGERVSNLVFDSQRQLLAMNK